MGVYSLEHRRQPAKNQEDKWQVVDINAYVAWEPQGFICESNVRHCESNVRHMSLYTEHNVCHIEIHSD